MKQRNKNSEALPGGVKRKRARRRPGPQQENKTGSQQENEIDAKAKPEVIAKKCGVWGKRHEARLLEERCFNRRFPTDKRFLERVVTPRLFAELARRDGDPAVSPRDYHCDCRRSFIDWLPVCNEVKPGCRFAGRALSDADQLWQVDPERAMEAFARDRNRIPRRFKDALHNYRGRTRPRGVKMEKIWPTDAQARKAFGKGAA